MSLGRGSVVSMLKKQKLNTKSLMECELTGADNMFPPCLLTRYFMESQGYEIRETIMYQDNRSVIFLEENGRGQVEGQQNTFGYVISSSRTVVHTMSIVVCM